MMYALYRDAMLLSKRSWRHSLSLPPPALIYLCVVFVVDMKCWKSGSEQEIWWRKTGKWNNNRLIILYVTKVGPLISKTFQLCCCWCCFYLETLPIYRLPRIYICPPMLPNYRIIPGLEIRALSGSCSQSVCSDFLLVKVNLCNG